MIDQRLTLRFVEEAESYKTLGRRIHPTAAL